MDRDLSEELLGVVLAPVDDMLSTVHYIIPIETKLINAGPRFEASPAYRPAVKLRWRKQRPWPAFEEYSTCSTCMGLEPGPPCQPRKLYPNTGPSPKPNHEGAYLRRNCIESSFWVTPSISREIKHCQWILSFPPPFILLHTSTLQTPKLPLTCQ